MRTAPLSSKARIGGLKQLSSPRMAAVCRVNRRVVAFKEDEKNYAEVRPTAASAKLAALVQACRGKETSDCRIQLTKLLFLSAEGQAGCDQQAARL
mgnify:CR=1 FL=1